MKNRLLSLSTTIGLLLFLIYHIFEKVIGKIPDVVGYPIMIISIIFMLVGIVYMGYCWGKRKNPFK